jgi:hypothetical protein
VKEHYELIEALQLRVSRLEGQSRRWRAVSVLTAFAGLLLVLVGPTRSETASPTTLRARTVEAREFLLTDARGQVRARLSSILTEKVTTTTPEGKVLHLELPRDPALQFLNRNGDEVWMEPKNVTLEPIR